MASISYRAAYAKQCLNEHLLEKLNDQTPPTKNYDQLPALSRVPDAVKDNAPYEGRICIVGAGAAGLYLAMMLKYIGITNVDIYEASNRIGGRLYTKALEGDKDYHNYYDVGAMRIPGIPWMQNTLAFIKNELGINPAEYIYNNPDAPCCYWYQNKNIDNGKFDAFMDPIVANFTADFDAAFTQWLTTDNDNYSTRSFLMTAPASKGGPKTPWTYDETTTAELGDTSTGLFDQSFTETVIDYADFKAADSKSWYRVDGGMQRVSDRMHELLKSPNWPQEGSTPVKVTKNAPVVAMANQPSKNSISVTVAGEKPIDYDMVFNTTAMAPLQRMDISGLELPQEILTGIRSLSYDRATKVAIRFKKAWWNKDSTKIYGGVSSSDLPVSNVVYPSWNDGEDAPAVLMVSYAWAQDATRMGALVPDYDVVKPSIDDPVVTVCLQSLVKLWQSEPNPPSFEYLRDQYLTHHAFAWSHDQYTGGAFALFGPGQFKNVYANFNQLFCNGRFAMAGEALSAHHAWICGAFDSAYIRMLQFLTSLGRTDDTAALKASIFGGGEGKHPEEMDSNLMRWCVLLGDGRGPKGWGSEYKLAQPSSAHADGSNGTNGTKY